MFLTAMYPSGRYINNKFSLCHKPSFATNVRCNSGLSAMINNMKNSRASIKEIVDSVPVMLSLVLNESIAMNRGTNKNSIKPMAEPAPCIFEEEVTISFVSLTLKKQVNIHAPTAKTAINKTDTVVKGFDT